MGKGCVSNAARVLHPRLRVVGAVTLTGITGLFIGSGLRDDLNPIGYDRIGSLFHRKRYHIHKGTMAWAKDQTYVSKFYED